MKHSCALGHGLRAALATAELLLCGGDVLAELHLWYHSFRMSSTRDVDASSGLNTHSEGIWHSEGAWEASLTRCSLSVLFLPLENHGAWLTMDLPERNSLFSFIAI